MFHNKFNFEKKITLYINIKCMLICVCACTNKQTFTYFLAQVFCIIVDESTCYSLISFAIINMASSIVVEQFW